MMFGNTFCVRGIKRHVLLVKTVMKMFHEFIYFSCGMLIVSRGRSLNEI